MKYLSLCSGIEAASVAWHKLGWKPFGFSEIEAFPSAVLKHHWPTTPNLGDMTKFADWQNLHEVDLLVGGTPCQAFSLAGLRKSLDDARGNLTLTYVSILNKIDHERSIQLLPPAICVWENVPGVLNTKDNAFGCFLAALAGEDVPLIPSGGRWTNTGYVRGPQRTIAWRVIDAQYFGVAQRRRRVFVVASAREEFCPEQVLFEFDGVRRDTAPSREARQAVTDDTGTGFTPSSFGAYGEGVGTLRSTGGDLGGGSETLVATFDRQSSGEYGVGPVASTMSARDFKSASDLVAIQGTVIGCKPENGPQGSGHDESGVMYTPTATDIYGVAYGLPGNWIGRLPENGGNATEPMNEVSPCLTGAGRHAVAYGFNGDQSEKTRSMGEKEEQAPTLRADGPAHVAYGIDEEQNAAEELMGCLKARTAGGGFEGAVAFAQNTRDEVREMAVVGALAAQPGMKQTSYLRLGLQVRRLTPIECHRLQGFPDGHCKIPWRGKPADQCPDGPQYKVLGNSMAVPCMAWIGERIDNLLFGGFEI